MAYNAPMDNALVGAVLGLGVGIVTTLIGVAAKYSMDYRSDRRRLQLQERAAVSDVMGGSPGQLQQSINRLHDRLNSLFRDDPLRKGWLIPSPKGREHDSYFLASIVHRLFAFLSWAAIVQWSIDALPPETVKERPDLRRLYKRLDDAKYCLTNYLILHESEHQTHEMGSVFLTDVLDDLCGLGLRTYQRNDKTIPHSEFQKEYRQDQYPLKDLRSWLTQQGWKEAIVLARLACLRECLARLQNKTTADSPPIDRENLTAALTYAETPAYAETPPMKSLNLPADVPGKLEKYLRRST